MSQSENGQNGSDNEQAPEDTPSDELPENASENARAATSSTSDDTERVADGRIVNKEKEERGSGVRATIYRG